MKRYKLAASCCVVVLICALFAGCVNTADMGTVNDKKITPGIFNLYALSAAGDVIQANGISSYEDLEALNVNGVNGKQLVINGAYDLILKRSTAERLFYAAGKKLTDEQESAVTSYISSMVQSMGGQAAFDKELKTLGVSQDEFKSFQRTSVIYSVYGNMIYGDGGTQPVTDADAKAYYDKNYVCAKHILVSTIDQNTQAPLPDEQKLKARAKAEEALAKVKAGADFDEMIKQYNEDPGMANNPKGYLFTKGEMVKPFEDAAFSMGVGEVSGIVESQFGYHIIKKLDKNADASLYEGVKTNVLNALVTERFDSYIKGNESGTSITKNEAQALKIDLKKFLSGK